MKRFAIVAIAISLAFAATSALASPISGTYTSTDLGGQILTGRASTSRTGVNTGLPMVLHAQSWNGSALGTQWDISCATENSAYSVADNRVGGVGTIVYTSNFNGGTFTFFPVGGAWGDGAGTLNTTTLVSTVQYVLIGGISTPVASVINGNTSGTFSDGCMLTFAIGNGVGVGETPYASIPATYPTFLDANTCGPASPSAQFGSWGNVITLTLNIFCTVGEETTSWGTLKGSYR